MSNQTIQFLQVNPEQLQNAFAELRSLKLQLQELTKNFEPKKSDEFLSRNEVSAMLGINLSTIHNWRSKGVLQAYQLGGKVLFKRSDIEKELIKLKK